MSRQATNALFIAQVHIKMPFIGSRLRCCWTEEGWKKDSQVILGLQVIKGNYSGNRMRELNRTELV